MCVIVLSDWNPPLVVIMLMISNTSYCPNVNSLLHTHRSLIHLNMSTMALEAAIELAKTGWEVRRYLRLLNVRYIGL